MGLKVMGGTPKAFVPEAPYSKFFVETQQVRSINKHWKIFTGWWARGFRIAAVGNRPRRDPR
jgi:hypothetical protein